MIQVDHKCDNNISQNNVRYQHIKISHRMSRLNHLKRYYSSVKNTHSTPNKHTSAFRHSAKELSADTQFKKSLNLKKNALATRRYKWQYDVQLW